jgi:hypothetical protein
MQVFTKLQKKNGDQECWATFKRIFFKSVCYLCKCNANLKKTHILKSIFLFTEIILCFQYRSHAQISSVLNSQFYISPILNGGPNLADSLNQPSSVRFQQLVLISPFLAVSSPLSLFPALVLNLAHFQQLVLISSFPAVCPHQPISSN